MKYSFNIDEKSLFKGMKNDCGPGHSPTISIPLNQAKKNKNERNDAVYKFIKGYSNKSITLTKELENRCLIRSKAKCKINNLYIFSKLSLDGAPFDTGASFAMYVKEEISPTAKNQNGDMVKNVHLGRQKLHYPTTFYYKENGFNIDNKLVLEKILAINGGFAYVVNGFDIDAETDTLNFRTTMVGLKGVLLSNVFKIKKGVGKKLLADKNSYYNEELVSLAKETLTDDENSTFLEKLKKIQESCHDNGKLGEFYVFENLKKIIGENIKGEKHISEDYPQSPYDIECLLNGKKLYIEVKATQQDKKMFYMSRGEKQFMDKYDESYLLVLVTKVNSEDKELFKYKRVDIMNENKMKQEYQSIKFIVK